MTLGQSFVVLVRMTKYGLLFDAVLYGLYFILFGADTLFFLMLGITIGMFVSALMYLNTYGIVPPYLLRDKNID